jgi:hypothetical protein
MLYTESEISLSDKVNMLNSHMEFIEQLESCDFIEPQRNGTPFICTSFIGIASLELTRFEANRYCIYNRMYLVEIDFDFDKGHFILKHLYLKLPIVRNPTFEQVQDYFNNSKERIIQSQKRKAIAQCEAEFEQQRIDRELRGKKPCTIYLMIDKSCGYYKIGRTANLKQREDTLLATRPSIEVAKAYNGVLSDEKYLHNTFKEKGYHVRGEWFNLPQEALDFISEHFKSN